MNVYRKERNAAIFEKYNAAPSHLKGRTIAKLIIEYDISRSQLYNIIKQEKNKYS